MDPNLISCAVGERLSLRPASGLAAAEISVVRVRGPKVILAFGQGVQARRVNRVAVEVADENEPAAHAYSAFATALNWREPCGVPMLEWSGLSELVRDAWRYACRAAAAATRGDD